MGEPICLVCEDCKRVIILHKLDQGDITEKFSKRIEGTDSESFLEFVNRVREEVGELFNFEVRLDVLYEIADWMKLHEGHTIKVTHEGVLTDADAIFSNFLKDSLVIEDSDGIHRTSQNFDRGDIEDEEDDEKVAEIKKVIEDYEEELGLREEDISP